MFYNSSTERLPRYYRILRDLLQNGIYKVSSSELSQKIGVSSSLVRSDLCDYKQCSIRGYGYNVKELFKEIGSKIGVGNGYSVIILGGDENTYNTFSNLLNGRGLIVKGHVSDVSEISKADIAVILDGFKTSAEIISRLEELSFKCIWNMTFEDIFAKIKVYNLPIGDMIMMMCADIGRENEI